MYWFNGVKTASLLEKYLFIAQFALGWSSESNPAVFEHGVWHQTAPTITIEYDLNTIDPHVHIALPRPTELHVKIEEIKDVLKLQAAVTWPLEWSVDTSGKVKIRLTKVQPEIWPHLTDGEGDPSKIKYGDFYPGVIMYAFKVSPNGESYFVKLRYANKMFQYVPPGHHIAVKKEEEDKAEFARAYTPVPIIPDDMSLTPGVWRRTDETFNLLIKKYVNTPKKTFYMTPWLCSTYKKRGTRKIYISNVRGPMFRNTLFKDKNELYFFAGGTGITPMLGIAFWAMQTIEDVKVKLLYFNKTPESVIWEEQVKYLAESYKRFTLVEAFSDPKVDFDKLDSDVTYEKGRVTPNMIEKYIDEETKPNHLICICGPPEFTMAVEDHLALAMHYIKGEDYVAFLGKRDPMPTEEEYLRRIGRCPA